MDENNNKFTIFQPLIAWQKTVQNFSWLNNALNPAYIKHLDAIKKASDACETLTKLAKQQKYFQEFTELFDSIVIELERRNINTEVIGELEFSEIFKLYTLSNKIGLTFADIAQDSLNMFGRVQYEQSVAYLQALNKRIKQVVKNNLKDFDFKDDFLEDLNALEEAEANAIYYIKLKIEEYEQGKIKLTEQEKNVLAAFKKNKFLSNSILAQMFGYSDRNIENICANIRKKFEMDSIEDKLVKRILLTSLARYITL